MKQLVPCTGCARHVRANESTCPFCGASIEADLSKVPGMPTARLGRAALFAFGATLAVTATACGTAASSDVPTVQDVPNGDTGGGGALYGAPVLDAGVVEDTGGGGARYGAVPPPDGQ